MILNCNECEWEFHIKSALIKDNGSNVRCSKCGNIWRVYPPEPDNEVLVLENGLLDEELIDHDRQLNELMESEDIEELEPDTDEGLQTDIAEDSEPGFDPDFNNDEGELPDLEGLYNFEEEDATNLETPDGENLLDPDPLGEDELDAIDLSDLERLVESDTTPPSMMPDADSIGAVEDEDEQLPEETHESAEEPELALADDPESENEDKPMSEIEAILKSDEDELFNIDPFLEKETDPPGDSTDSMDPDDDSGLELFTEPDDKREEKGKTITADEPQPEEEAATPIVVPTPAAKGDRVNRLPGTHAHVTSSPETQNNNQKPQIGRSRSKRLVFAVSAALLLFPGLLSAFYWYSGKDVSTAGITPWVTYIKDRFNSGDFDPTGTIKIKLLEPTVTDRFIDNHKAGELLIITGQVRNDYDHPCRNIKVTAKLYTEGGIEVRTATVYCGRIFSDAELSTLDIASINRHLNNRSDRSRSNHPAGIGKRVPFMVVFHDLPDNFDQYSVEVVESSRMAARL